MRSSIVRLVTRSHAYPDIKYSLQLTPTVDGFSLENYKSWDRWWGAVSLYGEDAFLQSWSSEKLWLNPPFSRLAEVVDKLERDQADALLVVPE